jgi:glycosyltransferase involved in cell wall biosynthesis
MDMSEITSKFKVVFAGCVRDCAMSLPSVLHNIERIASLYDQAGFIFVENDSKDHTKEIIKSWCDNRKNASLITLDGLASLQLPRTIRLAKARQEYIAALKAHFSDYSYLIVMDCDEINSAEIDIESVRRAITFLESDRSYAGVFANQEGAYYDLWALRHPEKCPGDVWEEVLDCATNCRLSDQEAINRTFSKRIFSLPLNAEPLEVDSAFGGFGIYKVPNVLLNRKDFIGYKKKEILTEDRAIEVGLQVCEHVSFNSGFREQHQRLFILPYLINATIIKMSFAPSALREKIFNFTSTFSTATPQKKK